jgi:hypothetical protein
MNALVSVNTPLGVLNAFLSPATINLPRALPTEAPPTAPITAAAPAGFVSLINLLLGPAEQDSRDVPDEPQPTRSPQLIADAIIRSMLDRSMPDGSLVMDGSRLVVPSVPTLATSGKATPSSAPAEKLLTPIGTPGRRERRAPAVSVASAPVATKPAAKQSVPAIPAATPAVASPLLAPPVAVTPAAPRVSDPRIEVAAPTPVPDDNSQPAPQPARDAAPLPVAKPELAFGLCLTPIETLKGDVSKTPVEPSGDLPAAALPQPDPPPAPSAEAAQTNNAAAEFMEDVIASVAKAITPVAPPKEASSKLPPVSPATPAASNVRPAPQSAQTAIPAVTAVVAIPTVADHSNPFARTFEPMAPALTAPLNAAPTEHAPQTAAEALRASEPTAPLESSPPPVSAQAIAVRITLQDVPPVDVHVIERAGQVQVAVRTPDLSLQSTLRQDLGTLVNSLERSGFHTEAFTPHDSVTPAGASSQMSFESNGRQQDTGSGERGHATGNPGGGNHDGRQASQQQPGQQRQRGRQSQTWIESMENAA